MRGRPGEFAVPPTRRRGRRSGRPSRPDKSCVQPGGPGTVSLVCFLLASLLLFPPLLMTWGPRGYDHPGRPGGSLGVASDPMPVCAAAQSACGSAQSARPARSQIAVCGRSGQDGEGGTDVETYWGTDVGARMSGHGCRGTDVGARRATVARRCCPQLRRPRERADVFVKIVENENSTPPRLQRLGA
jgi:hypothetical protein